jgi:ArsR family transcriptional regulator
MNASFDLSQPTVSHHLSLLKKAGLVECEVRGRWCFYRAIPEAIEELARVLEVAK